MTVVDGKNLQMKAENVAEMIVELKIEKDFIAVVKNGKIVPRTRWDTESVEKDDVFEIFSPVSGG